MEVKQACTAREEGRHQPVIVELTAEGTARLRQAPPDVLVMVVERKEIGPEGRHSLAAGAGGEILKPDADSARRPVPREIAVSFPG